VPDEVSALGLFPGPGAWFGVASSHALRTSARLARDRSGVALIEYALLAALIAMAVVAAISGLGENVGDHYDDIDKAMPGDDGGKGKGNGKGKGKGGN
jgi:pilus assembly protein Flp/PilA